MQGMGTISRFGLGLALMALAAPQGIAAGAGHVKPQVKPMPHMSAAPIKPQAHTGPMRQAVQTHAVQTQAVQTRNGEAEMVEVSDAPTQAVREVDDRATGVRWLLVRDAVHPAGPGRWIRSDVPGNDTETVADANGEQAARADARTVAPQMPDGQVKPPAPLVMRGGDPIVVVQQTPVLTARLSAVALEPAAKGTLIQARLKATDARVWVIAVGPGEATLAPPTLAPAGETGQWRAR
ncbi:MAG TPA: hypothetical protein VFU55_06550 [Terracidiphilus sp.]|nr:hypothetical protein [Terracidiphilus sp.]